MGASLKARLVLPELGERREDIPLLLRLLLRQMTTQDERIARRYFLNGDPSSEPRLTPTLVRALVQHRYTTHVRELEALLWQSITLSSGKYLELCDGMKIDWCLPPRESAVDPALLTAEVVQACLDKHQGRRDAVCKELGLSNRFVLYRLIKQHNLTVNRPRGKADHA